MLKKKTIQEIFNEWIDLRKLYCKHYLRETNGLYEALQELGLNFVGYHL